MAPDGPRRARSRRVVVLAAAALAAATLGPVLGVTASGPSVHVAGPAHGHVPGPVYRAQGTIPPNNPPANIPPSPNFLSNCSGSHYDNSPGCLGAVLQAVANGRAQEGLAPMSLPANWNSMTPEEQLFASTNLERTARGLPALSGMATALDQSSLQGAQANQDPTPPSGFPWTTWGSNWAAAVGNPLESIYFWMYDDGMNSGNIDCTSSNQSGCWGHRDNILISLSCRPCLMGIGFAPTAYQGYPSWTELLVDTSGSPRLDYAWGQVAPAASGPLDPDLSEFVPDHANNRVWNAYDQTITANGPGILGTPSAVVVSSYVHVYARGANNDLVEYVDDNANGRVWNAYDLTAGAGGGIPIGGDPSAVFDYDQGLVHVYVQGANGHLEEYLADHQNGHIWNAYDLTGVAGGGSAIAATPNTVFNAAADMIRIYVQATNGHLTEYLSDHQSGHVWNAYDLSAAAGGGVPISGTPSTVYNASIGLFHIYTEGANGHLTEYVPDHLGGHIWNAYDLSAAAGGGVAVGSSPSAIFHQAQGVIHVYIKGVNGELYEFVADHASGNVWNAYDLTAAAGAGMPVNGTPAALYVSAQGFVHVFVRSSANALVDFSPDHAFGHIWNAYNLTADAQAPALGTDASPTLIGSMLHVYVGSE